MTSIESTDSTDDATGSAGANRLRGRYERIANQLEELFEKVTDPQSRMASVAALLHSKMAHFAASPSTLCSGATLIPSWLPFLSTRSLRVLWR